MLGYVNKSKVSTANTSASSLYKAVSSSLTEMDEENYKIYGYYIICSDKKYNYNVPTDNFDTDKLYTKIDNFFADSDQCEWFVVVEYGYPTYVASSESWTSDLVGTYPSTATTDGPSYYSSYSYKREKASLTKLYNDAAPKVKSLAESYLNY
jgi:hypothetical protein